MTPPALADSSLADTLARVTSLDPYLFTDQGDLETDWFRASELRAGAPQLDAGLKFAITRYPDAERKVAGSFFFGNYASYLAGAAIGCYLAERRVPDLSPENVALRYSTFAWQEHGESGESERIDVRFLSGRFAALPDDPLAGHADVQIVGDQAALRDWLRRGLEAHLAPLVEALAARTRLGRRAQWSLAADACAYVFQQAGARLNDEAAGCAEGLTFLRTTGSPLYNRITSYFTLDYQGHRETFCARGGCCLYYRVAPGDNCSTCVLRPAEERDQLLLDYMAHKYVQEMPA
jgi:hypothetical protein